MGVYDIDLETNTIRPATYCSSNTGKYSNQHKVGLKTLPREQSAANTYLEVIKLGLSCGAFAASLALASGVGGLAAGALGGAILVGILMFVRAT